MSAWKAWIDPAPVKIDGATVNLRGESHRGSTNYAKATRRTLKPVPSRGYITDEEEEALLRIAWCSDRFFADNRGL